MIYLSCYKRRLLGCLFSTSLTLLPSLSNSDDFYCLSSDELVGNSWLSKASLKAAVGVEEEGVHVTSEIISYNGLHSFSAKILGVGYTQEVKVFENVNGEVCVKKTPLLKK